MSAATLTTAEAAQVIARKLGPILPLCYPKDRQCGCSGRYDRDLGRLVPHEGHDVGKAPISRLARNGVDDATTNSATIDHNWRAEPGAGVGLALEPARVLFIDPDSPEALAEAEREAVAGGMRRDSRNVGWLFRRPDDCPVISITKSADGADLEIRTTGYAVVWNTHQNGTPVRVDLGHPLQDAPRWAVERLKRKAAEKAAQDAIRAARRAERDAQGGIGSEPPVRLHQRGLQRWNGELVQTKPSGETDRSDSLYYIALDLAECGATEAAIRPAIENRDVGLGWRKYADRDDADERYTEIAERAVAHEIEKEHQPKLLIHSAALNRVVPAERNGVTVPAYGQGGRIGGASAPDDPPEIHSAGTPHIGAAETNPLFRTAREIGAETPPETEWVVQAYAARTAITELAGKLKASGKTTLIMAMVRAVIQGRPFLGFPTHQTGVVILTEQNAASFRKALERAELLDRDDVVVMFWHDVRSLTWPLVVQLATAECHRRGYWLLIVDTLSQFAAISGDGENNAGAALEAMRPVQEAAASGLSVILSRHERKGGGEVGESGRGSSAFSGAVDIVLALRRPEGQTRESVRVLQSLSRFDETPSELVIDLVGGEYHALGTAQDVKAQEARRVILAELPLTAEDAIDGKTLLEALKELKIKRTTMQAALSELIEDKAVGVIGAGKKGDPYRYWKLQQMDSAETTGVAAERIEDVPAIVDEVIDRDAW